MLRIVQPTVRGEFIRIAAVITLVTISPWGSPAGATAGPVASTSISLEVSAPSGVPVMGAAGEALPKVFISSLPGDNERWGGQTYNRFYAAVQNSKRYELVAAPAHADLIFEIRYTVPWRCKARNGGPRHPAKVEYRPQIALTIWDRVTNKLQGVYTESTADQNFALAIEALVNRAVGEPRPLRASLSSPERVLDAPLPSQISSATKVFISVRSADRVHGIEGADEFYNEVRSAMKSWGRYQLVSQVSDADLVFEMYVTEKTGSRCASAPNHPEDSLIREKQIELQVLVPNTDLVLWGFSQPKANPHRTAIGLVDQVRRLVTRADRDAGVPAAVSTAPVRP